MPEDPVAEMSYQIQSKATQMQLGVSNDTGWEEKRPHVMATTPGSGSLWLFAPADIGVRLEVGGPLPWGEEHSGYASVGALDSDAERQVYVLPPNDGAYQRWRLLADGEGYWQLVNVATGLALDGTNEDIYTLQPNDGPYQRWGFFHA